MRRPATEPEHHADQVTSGDERGRTGTNGDERGRRLTEAAAAARRRLGVGDPRHLDGDEQLPRSTTCGEVMRGAEYVVFDMASSPGDGDAADQLGRVSYMRVQVMQADRTMAAR